MNIAPPRRDREPQALPARRPGAGGALVQHAGIEGDGEVLGRQPGA